MSAPPPDRAPVASPHGSSSRRATRVTDEWALRGFKTVILENRWVRVVVMPELGAKIRSIESKTLDRNLLYVNPRIEPRAAPFGSNVDDYWTGGIDDAIPTGHPCAVAGEQLPFLGEAWSMPWRYERVSEDSVTFTRDGVITPFRISRTITVPTEEELVRLSYRITNVGMAPFPFIWGVHVGLPVGPATQIEIPARVGVVDESWPSDRLGAPGRRYPWPQSALTAPGPQPAGTWDLHYAIELHDGWAAAWDAAWRAGLGMRFDHQVLRAVWVWLVDGGWRGLRCVAVEPWTGWPARLDRAIAGGRAVYLDPGDSMETAVELTALESPDAFSAFVGGGAGPAIEPSRADQ